MSDSSSDSDSASANVKVWIDRDDTKIPVISGYRTARTDGPKSMVGLLGSKPKIRNLQRNSSVMFGDQSYSFDQQFRRFGTLDHRMNNLPYSTSLEENPVYRRTSTPKYSIQKVTSLHQSSPAREMHDSFQEDAGVSLASGPVVDRHGSQDSHRRFDLDGRRFTDVGRSSGSGPSGDFHEHESLESDCDGEGDDTVAGACAYVKRVVTSMISSRHDSGGKRNECIEDLKSCLRDVLALDVGPARGVRFRVNEGVHDRRAGQASAAAGVSSGCSNYEAIGNNCFSSDFVNDRSVLRGLDGKSSALHDGLLLSDAKLSSPSVGMTSTYGDSGEAGISRPLYGENLTTSGISAYGTRVPSPPYGGGRYVSSGVNRICETVPTYMNIPAPEQHNMHRKTGATQLESPRMRYPLPHVRERVPAHVDWPQSMERRSAMPPLSSQHGVSTNPNGNGIYDDRLIEVLSRLDNRQIPKPEEFDDTCGQHFDQFLRDFEEYCSQSFRGSSNLWINELGSLFSGELKMAYEALKVPGESYIH